MWETKAEKDIDLQDQELKEILENKKSAKSKRKKLELYQKCRKKLFLIVKNWKETPGMEEETLFTKLKETAMKEKILEELGTRRIKRNVNPEPKLKKTGQTPQ